MKKKNNMKPRNLLKHLKPSKKPSTTFNDDPAYTAIVRMFDDENPKKKKVFKGPGGLY